MDLTRKQFLQYFAGAGAAALGVSALGACDDDSSGKPPDAKPATDAPPADAPTADAAIDAPPMGNCTMNGTTITIGANHGHVLMIPKEDVVAGVEKTYTMGGGSHTHPIKITAAMFAMLQSNMTVMTDVEPSGHPHPTTITCA